MKQQLKKEKLSENRAEVLKTKLTNADRQEIEEKPREEQSYKSIYPDLNVDEELAFEREQTEGIKEKETIEIMEKGNFNNIEYNIDSTDFDFLSKVLFYRKPTEIEILIFELIIDRLEKEWYCFQQSIINRINKPIVSLDLSCNVCAIGDSSADNNLIYCDGCDLCVHQECYGIPYVPDEAWFCKPCLFSKRRPPKCKFCTVIGGAYKLTSDKKWAHIICTMWDKNLSFGNPVFLEPIEINNIWSYFNKYTCYICKNNKGITHKCSYLSCNAHFHITCGIQNENYLDQKNFIAYCDEHDIRNKLIAFKSDKNIGILSNEMINSKYNSDIVSKKDININNILVSTARAKSTLNDYQKLTNKPDIRNNIKISFPKDSLIVKIKNLKAKGCSYFVDKILTNDLCNIKIANKTEIVKKIMYYWEKKRLKKDILLSRLQLNIGNTMGMDWYKNRAQLCINRKDKKETSEDLSNYNNFLKNLNCKNHKLNINSETLKDVYKPFLIMQKIFKKYKEILSAEKEILEIKESVYNLYFNREKFVINEIFNSLVQNNKFYIFYYPVTEDIAPEYFTYIKQPMDLKTIKGKLKKKEYNLKEFKYDLMLIVNNCKIYNLNFKKLYDLGVEFGEEIEKKFHKYETILEAVIDDKEYLIDALK